jgi:two-component system sensor histidine kinase ArlS
MKQYLKKNSKTAQYQLTKHFLCILFLILLVSNLVYIVASAGFSYEYISKRADRIIVAIEEDQSRSQDWRSTVDAYVSAGDEDALKLSLPSGSVYYSNAASAVFEQIKTGKSMPLLPGIVFSRDDIYYVKHKNLGDFSVDIALDSEDILDLTGGLLRINLFLNAIALVLGAILIYFRVAKWSKKLTTMAHEIKELKDGKLTVPPDPIEITEVASAFNQLLDKQKQAIEREKQFVADASHDLKTPIAAIRGHVKLIMRRGKQHPEIVENSLDFIDKESKRLQLLTNRLLLLSKTTQKMQLARVNIAQVAINEVNRAKEVSNTEVEMNCNPDLWLMADSKDIELILQNLLENARKYAPGKVEVIASKVQDNLCLQVVDHGQGIADSQKDKIFERFYRVENSRSNQIEGSGIGLAIVKNLVEKYQGKISVKETPGGGSTFEILWPLKN